MNEFEYRSTAPLTRREARERELAAAPSVASRSRRSAARPAGRRSRMARRVSARAGRAVLSTRLSPARKKTFTSSILSLGSLLVVGALLVGSTVPVNAVMAASSAAGAPDTANARAVGSQTLRISADAVGAAPLRDVFAVGPSSEILALKYAGIDYSYSVTSGAVRWPFPTSVPITDGFGPRSSGFHKGTDFAAAAGTPIYAVADGVAVSSGYDNSGYGNHVVIQHDLAGVNVKSNSAHMIMDSSPIVAGQQIKVGDFLGLVGNTGISYGAHLHFEILVDDVPIDSFAWLQANASN
ncbi:MAG: M23 family metallopeptidase [Rhodoglobus sp.]